MNKEVDIEPKWEKDEWMSRHGNVKETIKFGVFEVSLVYNDRYIHLQDNLPHAFLTIYDTMNDSLVFHDCITNLDLDDAKEMAVAKFGIWIADMQSAIIGANGKYLQHVASKD